MVGLEHIVATRVDMSESHEIALVSSAKKTAVFFSGGYSVL